MKLRTYKKVKKKKKQNVWIVLLVLSQATFRIVQKTLSKFPRQKHRNRMVTMQVNKVSEADFSNLPCHWQLRQVFHKLSVTLLTFFSGTYLGIGWKFSQDLWSSMERTNRKVAVEAYAEHEEFSRRASDLAYLDK